VTPTSLLGGAMKKQFVTLTVVGAVALAACGGSSDGGADPETSGAPNVSTPDAGSGAPVASGAAAVDIDAMLAADLDNCAPAPTGDPIKVGMAMDFSEVVGFVDIPGSKLVPYVAELINCIGGVNGSPVEVRVEDVGGDAATAGVAAETLLDWGAHTLIGPPFADFALPILQATEGKVPLFVAASTEPSLANAEQNSFLVTFDDNGQSTAAANYALEQGKTRAFVLTQPGPYTGLNPDVFSEVFKAGGGEIVSSQTYVWGEDTDFSAQVSELSDILQGDEVFFSAALGFQLTALRGQLEGAGFTDITYMGTDALDATGIQAEGNSTGVIHTPHDFIEPGDRSDTLLANYATAKGEELESRGFMALYVDSLLLSLQGVADCGCVEPADIGAAVAKIEGFDGLSGVITYAGTNGIPPKAVPIVQVQDGVDVLLESK
jgi:branched-chain amino acid transport system substrate-binding protein